ncbi:small nuclear ribonucleoprotein F [Gregarina niphandrodes]|uniref:Sm protein F n=1 Tax=Gregarina niphandrodes TaxID=110365 RepID=A0A023B1B4_GRENI|nr:small nuclear ribonucleoprotein F [Gregarina niphandrodes]EZG46955.1 small nuclear ribonucleoprotein F [Gregarina niphandrodes]|eukprot:XP_011132230.1 small nuclear ribonucleoprotein F [Gregarina niphandrodes]
MSLQGERIAVRLKWGLEYRGKLVSFDRYFNIQLDQASEWKGGEFAGELGQLFIRCNNVLWVRADNSQPVGEEETGEVKE